MISAGMSGHESLGRAAEPEEHLKEPIALDAPTFVFQSADRRGTDGMDITPLPGTADFPRDCRPTHLPFPTSLVDRRVQRSNIEVSVWNFQVGPRCPIAFSFVTHSINPHIHHLAKLREDRSSDEFW